MLAQALVHEGLRSVAAGANPMGLKRGMDAAAEAVGDALREAAREVETKEDMASVATISSRDSVIGDLLAEAFDKVGKDGVITVEESNTMGTELEFTEGMQFDKGYISAYFVTDPESMEAVLEDPYENLGAQLAKEVATKTNDIAGDGTTTATVLAQAMVKELALIHI